MLKKYNAAVIGLGRIGHTLGFDQKREQPASHSRALFENPRIRLLGGFDIDPEKSAGWQKEYPSAAAYSSLESLLETDRWDILSIAVPEEFHLPVIREVLDKPPRLIILEKPVAPKLKDALKIRKLVQGTGIPVIVNHERRFSADYQMAREWVRSGRYGKIKAWNASLLSGHNAVYGSGSRKGQGTLIHDGTHLFDILRFLSGKEIRILHADPNGKDKTGGFSGIQVSAAIGDSPLSAHIGFKVRAFMFEIEILLEKARIRIGNGILELWESRESPFYEKFYSFIKDETIRPPEKTGYFSGMVRHCVDFLDGKTELESTLDDGIEALRCVEKIRETASK